MSIKHGWNSDYEEVVKSIGEESKAYAWMNRQTGNYRKKLDDVCDITVITLAALATLGGTALGLISDTSSTIAIALNILVPSLTAIAAIVVGIRKHYSWNKLFPLNYLMYRRFNSLANDCSTILMLYRNHRYLTGKSFVEKKGKKFNKLTKTDENNILEKFRKQFSKNYSNTGMYIPEQIKEIVITKDSDTTGNDSPVHNDNSQSGSLSKFIREIVTTNTDNDDRKTEILPRHIYLASPFQSNAIQKAEKIVSGRCKSEFLDNLSSDDENTVVDNITTMTNILTVNNTGRNTTEKDIIDIPSDYSDSE